MTTTLRIAHVTTVDISLRGLLLNQLLSLKAAGYDITGISAPGTEVGGLETAGIPHHSVPMTRNCSPLADLVSLWRLYRLMRRERFTIVHTHTPKAGLLGQLAARLAGVPIVVNTVHGFYFHEHMRPAARRFYITLEKIAARCSDLILSQNSEDLETALRQGICRIEKVKLLGNGIDLTQFNPDGFSAEDRLQYRRKMGIAADAFVVGFVGRLAGRRKGFLDFLAAAQRIAEERPEVRFLIVGGVDHGKSDAVEPSAATDFGIADRCLFLGERPNSELPPLYTIMNVLVLPSLFEGVPRVVMEASAMGVPSVVTDVKGNREAVAHRQTGLLVPLGDVGALAASVVWLLSEPETAQRMGRKARRIAAERFDERAVFQKVKAEYARLLREKGLSPPALYSTERKTTTMYRLIGKRLFDLALTIPALLVLAPVMAVIAWLVRLNLGLPVLFRHQRPGAGGRPFLLLKFQTMTDARDANGELLPDEQRVTPLGRTLRRTSLDELPELVNVLKGNMSLVGPRPLMMSYLDRYTAEQMRRHEVLPGITGLAQVSGRNNLSWEEKFALDVWYVDHCSLWLDIKILVMTFRVVLGGEGVNPPSSFTAPEFMGTEPAAADRPVVQTNSAERRGGLHIDP
jgi:lipopolysaccharide/colanic/teichoic acid biosynthesis glycosyltransferase/glycosyltransferase involved in cell wall biosynthesis